jgi:hypothetical protein
MKKKITRKILFMSIQGIQEMIYNLISVIQKLTNHERDTNIHLHCKLNKFPSRIIKTKILYNDIKKLKRVIEKDGYELTIPTFKKFNSIL